MAEDREILHDRIKQRAYEIWEQEGRPEGREQHHWDRAAKEVLGGPPSEGEHPHHATKGVNPVAPPLKGEQPGASSSLGGTPGDLSTGPGRARDTRH